jgi:hypothetical protein
MKRPTEEPNSDSKRPKPFVSGAVKYHELGITCFIHPTPRSCGKVKQRSLVQASDLHRFSDFLVNEMDLEGNIVQMTLFEPPVVEKEEETSVLDSTAVLAQLALLIGQDQVDLLHSVTRDAPITLKVTNG